MVLLKHCLKKVCEFSCNNHPSFQFLFVVIKGHIRLYNIFTVSYILVVVFWVQKGKSKQKFPHESYKRTTTLTANTNFIHSAFSQTQKDSSGMGGGALSKSKGIRRNKLITRERMERSQYNPWALIKKGRLSSLGKGERKRKHREKQVCYFTPLFLPWG